MFWFGLSSLTHVDLILSLFQICINSQGEKNTLSQFLELVEYNQTLLTGCLSIVQLTYSLIYLFVFISDEYEEAIKVLGQFWILYNGRILD